MENSNCSYWVCLTNFLLKTFMWYSLSTYINIAGKLEKFICNLKRNLFLFSNIISPNVPIRNLNFQNLLETLVNCCSVWE